MLLLAIVLLVFGPGRLAQAGKGLGEAIRNFKAATREEPAKDAKDQP